MEDTNTMEQNHFVKQTNRNGATIYRARGIRASHLSEDAEGKDHLEHADRVVIVTPDRNRPGTVHIHIRDEYEYAPMTLLTLNSGQCVEMCQAIIAAHGDQ